MKSDFKMTSEQVQARVPVTVFHVGGWLDAQSEPLFLEAARSAYEAGTRYLLIEMSELDILTSAGMRAIQKVYQMLTPSGDPHKTVRLKLCSAPPQIYNVLGITGFLHNLPMYESLESALGTFGEK